MYAMLCTQLDISFVVSLVSCDQNNLGPAHWHAIKRIMCYVSGTIDMVLCYQRGNLKLNGHPYAHQGGELDESR